MMEITWVGALAGVLTSIAVLPQIIKTWRTRHARDLSLWQQLILIVGLSLWLYYGIALDNMPLIASNSFTLLCYVVLLAMKILFDRADKVRLRAYIDTNNHS